MSVFHPNDIPSDLSGQIFVITGTSAGIGTQMVRLLGRSGATVIVGNRSNEKAQKALEDAKVAGEEFKGTVHFFTLDLCQRDSILDFADKLQGTVPFINGLILNAGVMALPTRTVSDYGVETQMATNVAGHHLLTSLLLPKLLAAPRPSVIVSTSSGICSSPFLDAKLFDDLNAEKKYDPWGAYALTKAIAIMWRSSLHRLLLAHNLADKCHVMASHPGQSATPLFDSDTKTWMGAALRFAMRVGFYMKPEQGCLGSLQAVLDPTLPADSFVGPSGLLSNWGDPHPMPDFAPTITHNEELMGRVWEFLEEKMKPKWPWTA